MISRANVMWQGTCTHLGLQGRLETAALSGCDTLSLTPHDYMGWLAEGLSATTMRAMADDHGVHLGHLDPLATWAPLWVPDNVDPGDHEYFGTSVDDFVRIVESLECSSVTALCSFPTGALGWEPLVEPFARLCDRLAGIRVDLEFIPFWGLPTLESAWEIVRAADCPNGGIMFDFWHFSRGESRLDTLSEIPPEKIHAVQISDAMTRAQPGRTVLQDTLEDRLPLGEGEFAIDDLLAILARNDALGIVGPEYFSSRMAGLRPREIAALLDETYWRRVEPYGVLPSQRQ